MARPESGYTPAFQEVISYPDYALSPANVTTHTADVLDFYFESGVGNLDPARDYLRNVTLPFLRNAQKGFVHQVGAVDRLGLISEEDYQMIAQRKERFGNEELDPLEHEAFGYTLVTFSALPEVAKHPNVPTGFSKRGLLAPPATAKEFLWRIDEMGMQVAQLAAGYISPYETPEKNQSLWRTRLFFEVGRELPEFYDDNQKNTQLFVQDTVSRLLDGIDVEI